jgi:hypothetical protein
MRGLARNFVGVGLPFSALLRVSADKAVPASPALTRLCPPIPQTLHFAGCTAWPDALQSPEAATPMHRYRCFNV